MLTPFGKHPTLCLLRQSAKPHSVKPTLFAQPSGKGGFAIAFYVQTYKRRSVLEHTANPNGPCRLQFFNRAYSQSISDSCLTLISLSLRPLLICFSSDGNGVFNHQQSQSQPILWVKPLISPRHHMTVYLAP